MMQRVYVLVEGEDGRNLVDGRYDFAVVPRIGEHITIGALGKDAFYRVVDVVNHGSEEDERVVILDRVEIKAEVVK